ALTLDRLQHQPELSTRGSGCSALDAGGPPSGGIADGAWSASSQAATTGEVPTTSAVCAQHGGVALCLQARGGTPTRAPRYGVRSARMGWPHLARRRVRDACPGWSPAEAGVASLLNALLVVAPQLRKEKGPPCRPSSPMPTWSRFSRPTRTTPRPCW